MIDEDININGEYYVNNLLIQDGLPNFVYEIPVML